MEIVKIGYMRIRQFLLYLVFVILVCACSYIIETGNIPRRIHTTVSHTLVALTPEFSLQSPEMAIHKQYLLRNENSYFPIIGILRVDGKSYRFIGGDSLRIIPLLSLSDDICGWPAKYSFLYPGAGWKDDAYNDILWNDGVGAFGSEDNNYTPHTIWGANKIYVRRHFSVNDMESLKERKLYLRYICDDGLNLYCNGKDIFKTNRFATQLNCLLLDELSDYIKNGDNIIAAYGYNIGGPAMMDFGLYMENVMYNKADTAYLENVDVQATQTHYTFRCGEIELSLNFVSSTLLSKSVFSEAPVGFMSYQVKESGEDRTHDIEILFDVDIEWMYGKKDVENIIKRGWRIVNSEGLYIGGMVDMEYSFEEGHVVFSQKLCGTNKSGGVLLFGYNERDSLQYEGENLIPYWNREGDNELLDLLVETGERYMILENECKDLDYQWNKRAFRFNDGKFAEKMFHSYRNFYASHRFVETSEGKKYCFADTLGCVRDAYKNFPSLMFFERIDCMKALLDPIFEYCESGYWRKRYPPYDIGLYPVANRQVKVKDYGVEVAADMLMMVAAMVEKEKDFDYADLHWETLSRWAGYLRENLPEEHSPADELLNGNDERVKCVLGLKAYYKLIELKDVY